MLALRADEAHLCEQVLAVAPDRKHSCHTLVRKAYVIFSGSFLAVSKIFKKNLDEESLILNFFFQTYKFVHTKFRIQNLRIFTTN